MTKREMTKGRWTLASRIGLLILVALAAVQMLNAGVLLLLPAPKTPIFSGQWLISTAVAAGRAIFAAPPGERDAVTRKLNGTLGLDLQYSALKPGAAPTENGPIFARLKETLESELADRITLAEFVLERPQTVKQLLAGGVVFVPADFKFDWSTGALRSGSPDVPVVGEFDIVMAGKDGGWLTISPVSGEPAQSAGFVLAATLAGSTALVAALSLWFASRFLEPLNRLMEASRQVAVSREPVILDLRNLREFGPIGSALNVMQARIKRFLDDRSAMLASISHDLRTPLTRMRVDIEALTNSPVKAQLASNIEQLERMLAATLTFAGDDLRAEPLDNFDLAAMLMTLCDQATDLGGEADYLGPDHCAFRGKPQALKRALQNLIDNAVKYGDRASVSLTSTDDGLVVDVQDEGSGIALSDVEVAFTPFRRLDRPNAPTVDGAGLGLAIARDVLLAHGGAILPVQGVGQFRMRVFLPRHIPDA